jgi:hypothetical protein
MVVLDLNENLPNKEAILTTLGENFCSNIRT